MCVCVCEGGEWSGEWSVMEEDEWRVRSKGKKRSVGVKERKQWRTGTTMYNIVSQNITQDVLTSSAL